MIKLDSPGPVFFKQTRFGFNNQPIRVLKFRTMHVNRGDPSGAQRTVRASPARKPVKLFLRRRQLLDSGHDQAYVWVVGAAGAAWITATADNGLVGFQKAAQRPGRSSLSPCRSLCAILRDGRYPPELWSHDRQPRSSPPSRCGSLRSPHRIAMRFDRKVGRTAARNVTACQGAPAARQRGSSHTNCRRQITSGPAGPESLRKSAERNIGSVQYHHHFL